MSQNAAVQHAAALHQAGRLDQAEPIYRQILAAYPSHPDALHLLGVLRHQRGDTDGAIALLRQAIAAAPRAPAFHNSLGNVLRAAGDHRAAADAYRSALRIEPNTAMFHQHLGMALRDSGDKVGAERALRQAIRLDRQSVGGRLELVNLLIELERWDQAQDVISAAVRQAPGDAAVANAQGIVCAGQGRHEEAVAWFDRALALRPHYPTALFNKANSLKARGLYDEAVTASAEAIEQAPADTEILAYHVELLLLTKQFVAAEAGSRRLMSGAPPEAAQAQLSLGRALIGLDRPKEALACFRAAAEALDTAPAWHLTGLVLRDLGDWAAALVCLARATERGPSEPGVQSDYGYALMANGRINEAWPYFEYRNSQTRELGLETPRWDGAETDRTVLIHIEQGAGDVIQFARFLPIAGAKARIVLATRPSLGRLLSSLPNVSEIATGLPIPKHDLHAPIMSLPKLLELPVERLGMDAAYLKAPDEAVNQWARRLAHLPRPLVGVVWAGNPDYPADRQRSLSVGQIAPLISLETVNFVSLQVGSQAGQCVAQNVYDAAEYLSDFSETAAALTLIDLLISVDTSVAHLAGALARPVWLLNRCDTDWRWMTGRTDSLWYPTMRIFRQPQPGDWNTVIAEVGAELKQWRELQCESRR